MYFFSFLPPQSSVQSAEKGCYANSSATCVSTPRQPSTSIKWWIIKRYGSRPRSSLSPAPFPLTETAPSPQITIRTRRRGGCHIPTGLGGHRGVRGGGDGAELLSAARGSCCFSKSSKFWESSGCNHGENLVSSRLLFAKSNPLQILHGSSPLWLFSAML